MYLQFFPLPPYSTLLVFQPFSSRFLWLIVTSILLLLPLEEAFSQEAIRILSHQFAPNDITVGDPVQLRLRIEADENLHIYLDPVDDSEHQHLEIDKPQVKQIKSGESPTGKVRYEVTYPLRAFAIGVHSLPPIKIKYTGADGSSGSVQTAAYSFEVQPVKPPGATEMKGIKEPWSTSTNWLPYILAALLVIIVVGALIFFYLRKRAKSINFQPEVVPQRQPHEIAYEQLNQIEGMNWVAQDEMKIYHTEISHVIRQYIAARYHIPALELTTQEVLDRLHPEDIPIELVRQFFTNCDLVKFALYSPAKPEAHERMEEARRVVNETKQFSVGKGEGQGSEILKDP